MAAGLDLERALSVAEAAADAARREIMPRFRKVAVRIKADGSPVTDADQAAERAMRAVLRSFEPGLPILGEEYGLEDGGGDNAPVSGSDSHSGRSTGGAGRDSLRQRRGAVKGMGGRDSAPGAGWVIDPIDGTLSFSRGLPLFGTLIALFEDGAPVLGLIDLPALGERTAGYRGFGVWRSGARVRVSGETDLRRAIIAHGDAEAFERFGARAEYERLTRELPLLRGYSDAFGHAMVLGGAVGAMVDVNLKPWDIAATQALVPEAGGHCLCVDRGAQGFGLIFGNPALVAQLGERLGW